MRSTVSLGQGPRPGRNVHVRTLLVLLSISLAFGCSSHATQVERPAGVVEHTVRLALLDRTVLADTYRPGERNARAVVIVAHGFSRTRDTLVSLARELAAAGFAVVVPDLPQLGDHEANARFLAALGETIRNGAMPDVDFDTQRIVFAGFSAGGLATLLAAARSQDVLGWIGLDPVDRDGMAVRAASELLVPAFVVRAPPSPATRRATSPLQSNASRASSRTAWRLTRRTAISSLRPIRAASLCAVRPRRSASGRFVLQ